MPPAIGGTMFSGCPSGR